MSYILDALKKAEAERNPGSVPSIHAQPVFIAPPADRPSVWRKPWLWMALPALTVALAGVAWLKPWQALSPSAAKPPAPEQVSSAPAPAVPLLAAAEPPQAEPEPPQAEAARAPKPPAAKPRKAAAKKSEQAAKPVQTKPASTARSSDEPRVAALHELPDNIKKEIPALNVNGYIYSDNKADRTVLIDHKLLQEGDQVAPNLILEKLMPDGMVLNYKGHRYRTAY